MLDLSGGMKVSESSRKIEDYPEWLSLGQAAELLGVHNMTLRRWSDSGQFPCYRTAGGHRRYAIAEVKAYLERQKGDSDSQNSADWADRALVETRQQVASDDKQRWLKKIGEEELREEYRQMGHQLMGLLLQYVATEEPNGTFIEEAQRIGKLYGAYGLRAGLSLSNILEATLFFRDILVESSLQVPATTYVEPDSSLRILRRVNQVVNTIQLSIADHYEASGYVFSDNG